MGRGLCRHGEGKQNGRHRLGSEGMAPAVRTVAGILPQIKALDAQIAKSPNDPATAGLLLERARIFTLAGRPLLALDDAQRALKLQPASMRARIQTAEALLDTGRAEDAAKLQVGRLARSRGQTC